MAKKAVTNSQAVRDYLATDPEAMPKDVRAALAKKRIEVSRQLVSTIKNSLKKAGKTKKAPKPAAAPAPAAIATPTKPNGTITLEQIKKVASTIKTLGGYQRMTEVLEVIKETGGVKKFRDLAEAMTATATDDIPF